MLRLLILAALSVVLPALVEGQERDVYREVDFLGADIFLDYIDRAGLTDLLQNPDGNLAVFAPSQNAFRNLAPDVQTLLDTNATLLEQVMRFHLAEGPQPLDENNEVFQTLANSVARVDIYADAGLTMVSDSVVLLAEKAATNGEVSVLDRLMYPLPDGDALDHLIRNGFTVFLTCVTKAAQSALLRGSDVTVFAPTDEAFASLPPGVLADLLADVPLLTSVIEYHVVSRVLYSAYFEARGTMQVTTANGDSYDVTVVDDQLMVDSASVTTRDVNINNGVLYVLDTVLMPPQVRQRLYNKSSFRVVP